MATGSLQKRNTALDAVRVVAVAAVIMIHISADLLAGYELGTSQFIWGNIADGFSRIGVPLFVMTSGALMLDEQIPFSYPKLFRKKIPQTFLLLVAWSGIYALAYHILRPFLKGWGIDFQNAAYFFITGHYHLWYLFMQIGLYLMLPFLRSFVTREKKNLVLLYIGFSLATAFSVPLLNVLSTYWVPASYLRDCLGQFKLDFFGGYVCYFLTGWYLVHVGISSKRVRWMLYCLALAALTAAIGYVHVTKDYANAYGDIGLPVYLYSVGVFVALTRITGWKPSLRKILSALSGWSFGIYVVHVAIYDMVKLLLPQTWYPPVYIAVCFVSVFSLSLLLTVLLSRLPFARKLVRG